MNNQPTFQVPGAQVPPVTTEQLPGGMPMNATMDRDGNVRLEATLGPQDRAILREVAQDQARQYADSISGPRGLAGLFPSNKVRMTVRQRSNPTGGQ